MSTAWLLAQPGATGNWQWDFAAEILPRLLKGLWVTVQATLVGITVAMILGLMLALLRRSRLRILRWPARAFIEFVRSTPLLVQLFFLFFVLPSFGLTLSPFVALVVGLGLHYGTYTSESYRAGIESVERGQWEAAVTMSLPTTTTWTRIVLPQAIPTVIPALGNYLVSMFKDAPLGSAISVIGVLATAKAVASVTFRSIEPYSMAGLLFLTVSVPAAIFVRYLERRYGFQRA